MKQGTAAVQSDAMQGTAAVQSAVMQGTAAVHETPYGDRDLRLHRRRKSRTFLRVPSRQKCFQVAIFKQRKYLSAMYIKVVFALGYAK